MLSRKDHVDLDLSKKKGSVGDHYAYGAACSEVEIDILTGENQVYVLVFMLRKLGKKFSNQHFNPCHAE